MAKKALYGITVKGRSKPIPVTAASNFEARAAVKKKKAAGGTRDVTRVTILKKPNGKKGT